MFRIGEFAQIAQVSGRLLRYYDQIGLLQPVRIDPQTGYRYYSARQLPRLNRILALKSLGLSLDQIATMIDGGIGPQEMRGMLMLRKSQVERTLEEEQARLREIESRIRQIDEDGVAGDFDIVVKTIAAQPFLSVRRRCPDLEHAIAVLRQVVAAGSKVPARARDRLVVVAYNDFAGEELDLALGFSLTERVNRTIRVADDLEMTVGELPAVGEMATVVRAGPNYQSHRAFGSLGLWIEANGYRIAGPSREVFLDLPFQDPATDESIVEIQFPVRKSA
jgi:DNA-binding transcriptional MerR regulator